MQGPLAVEELSDWVAPPGTRDHAGSPLKGNEVFFVRPDPALGEIRSAYTTMRAGQVQYSRATQLLTFWLTLLGSAVVVQAVLFGLAVPKFGYWVLSVGVPIALVMWADSVVGFRHEVSYVGSLGVARFGYRFSRRRLGLAEVFLFEEAGLLLVECQKDAYSIIWCTAWTWSWMRWEDEAVVFSRSGRFFSRSDRPSGPDNLFHFVRAAEVAWSEYLLAIFDSENDGPFSVDFYLNPAEMVRMSFRRLEFYLKNEESEFSGEELRGLKFTEAGMEIGRSFEKEKGTIDHVVKVDLKWARNAMLFRMLVERRVCAGLWDE